MTRRFLLQALTAAAADPERLIWQPGRKIISVPSGRDFAVTSVAEKLLTLINRVDVGSGQALSVVMSSAGVKGFAETHGVILRRETKLSLETVEGIIKHHEDRHRRFGPVGDMRMELAFNLLDEKTCETLHKTTTMFLGHKGQFLESLDWRVSMLHLFPPYPEPLFPGVPR